MLLMASVRITELGRNSLTCNKLVLVEGTGLLVPAEHPVYYNPDVAKVRRGDGWKCLGVFDQ